MRRPIARACIALGCVVVASAVVAGTAQAQKGVVGMGASPYGGVLSIDGESRYVSLPVGEGSLVERIEVGSGRVDQTHLLPTAATVPAVAYDGTAGGLSHDGQTLILPEPAWRFPQRESRFNVFDAEKLRGRDPVVLDGTWTFDALSPDGGLLYLIEYTSPRDMREYAVRVYDLREGKLDPQPVVDPNEEGEEMYGSPLTRSTSPDGRWAYTLYESLERDHPPFVHALDTVGRTAVCIDLDLLADSRSLYRLALQPSADGASLAVVDRADPVAIVDLETFEVSDPAAPARVAPNEHDGGGMPVALAGGVIAIGAVGFAGSLVALRRRRRANDG